MLLVCCWLLVSHTGAQDGRKAKKVVSVVSGAREVAIQTWDFLGPFGVGKTEIDGDPVAAFGGIRNVSRTRGAKKRMFVSELAEGGRVGWSRLRAESGTGAILLQFPLGEKARVDFGRNVQALNRITALEMQGWLVADFDVAGDGRYLLRCSPAHHVELDDDHLLLHGDVYSRGFAWSAVTLASGRHTIYIRVRAKGSASIGCSVRAASDPVEMFPTHIANPDIVASSLTGSPPMLAMHVLNTGMTWRRLSLRVARSQLPPVARKSWAKGRSIPQVINAVNTSTWLAPGQSAVMAAELALALDHADDHGHQRGWADLAPGDGDCMILWLHAVAVEEGTAGGWGGDGGSDDEVREEVVSADLKTGLR